jgi:carboxylate-amine ligase
MPISAPRFGIEEEFFLCDEASRVLLKNFSKEFIDHCHDSLGDRISHELLACQLELKTPIAESANAASDFMESGRETLAKVAADHGIRIFTAGTHPLAQWRRQKLSGGSRYDAIHRDFTIIARRNLLCGLHVHVEIPSDIDRIWLMNQLMESLPLLLALSGSSPFWSGQDTGLSSYRQVAYDEWPRTGIPKLFSDEKEYRRYVDILLKTGAIEDESFIWWTIRPSLRFPTLELRITDACPRLKDSLCLAEIFRVMVWQHIQRWYSGVRPTGDPILRLIIEENRWRAKRFGPAARLINLETDSELTTHEAIMFLRTRCSSAVEQLGAEWAFEQAARIAQLGGSAERQRAVYRRAISERNLSNREALGEVIESLIAETRG